MSQVEKLTNIYNTYGPKSKELARHLEKFIYSLLNRYFIGWNKDLDRKEDILQEVYAKIYTSLDYFDSNKGNLATFLYRSIVNCIQTFQDKENRVNSNNYEFETDFGNIIDFDCHEKDELLINRLILASLEMKFSDEMIDHIVNKDVEIEPINRLIAWRKQIARKN